MNYIRPLPAYLVQRFQGWRATTYQDNRAWYRRLAASGQHPRAMVISCCDSRVHVTSIFGADEGEFFIHRNVANLVPPYNPDGEYHGTSAAVEYAVTSLGVAHIVVLGHSNCGAVRATLTHLQAPGDTSPALRAIVDRIAPGIQPVLTGCGGEADACMPQAIRANVMATIGNLRAQSDYLRYAELQGGLRIVGADYDLGSGAVDFFATEPQAWPTGA